MKRRPKHCNNFWPNVVLNSSVAACNISHQTSADAIFYEFSRLNVERVDFKHFLSLFAVEMLPSGRPLREMMGKFVFFIEGYDADPRVLHTVPEVRKFYSAFHAAWPYWLFFCSLEHHELKPMVFSCLNSSAETNVDDQDETAYRANALELMSFLRPDLAAMKEMCVRSGTFEHIVQGRIRKIGQYFNLPCDFQ